MIELTSNDDFPVWVNVDHIVYVRKAGDGGSAIVLSTGDKRLYVRETPEQVLLQFNQLLGS